MQENIERRSKMGNLTQRTSIIFHSFAVNATLSSWRGAHSSSREVHIATMLGLF